MKTHDEMIRDLYARRDAYELQKQAQKRKIKRTALRLSGIAACLIICLTVGLGMYQETKAPSEKTESSETTQHTPSDSAGESEDDESESRGEDEGSVMDELSRGEGAVGVFPHIGPLQMVNSMSAAIVEITGIEAVDDENLLCKGYKTRLNCRQLYYRSSSFIPFQTGDSILVTEGSADDLAIGDILFFEVSVLNADDPDQGNWEYVPNRRADKSRFIRFTDGKLVFEEDELKWFASLREYNRLIDLLNDIANNRTEENNSDPVYGIQMRFNSGMTVEEVIAYFHEVERLCKEGQKRMQERMEELGMSYAF